LLEILQGPPRDKAHWEAFGRFIGAFASAESAVHLIARKLSGLSDQKARLIFSGMRLDNVIESVRNFIRIDRTEADKSADEKLIDIEKCLNQLKLISKRRSSYFDGALVSSNSLIAKSIANIEVERLSVEILTDMQLDCGAIFIWLLQIAIPDSKNSDDTLAVLRQRPWRYTADKTDAD
jgi:hypothetical protein